MTIGQWAALDSPAAITFERPGVRLSITKDARSHGREAAK